MEPTAIGARHPRLRRLRRLTGRPRARSEERAFVVDGPRLVAEALASDLEVEEVFGAADDLARLAADRAIGPAIDRWEVDPSVLASILDPVTPRPLAAVVRRPSWSPADVAAVAGPILVAVELRDPGNLGTVIRTAAAAGLAGVLVAGESVDRFAPKVVRASAGSLFHLPVADADDPVTLLAELRAAGRTVAAAVVDPEATPYERVDLSGAALVLGNEPHGLPDAVVAAATVPVTIPMAPEVESLNVGAAAAVLCFEAARQRRSGAGSADPDGGEIRWTATARGPKVSTMSPSSNPAPDEAGPPRTVPT